MACVLSGNDYYSKGNEAFVEEDYQRAVDLYNQAIELDDVCSEYYANRGHAYLKLKKYEDCRADADAALELGLRNGKIYYRKGIACYQLEDYEEARQCFLSGANYEDADSSMPSWLQKCEKKLDDKKTSSVPSPTVEAPVIQPNIRHEWYQTEPDVILSILLKNAKSDNVKIQYTENTVKCCINRGENMDDFNLELNLAHTIIPDRCCSKVLSTKIDVKLKKAEGLHWSCLERKETDKAIQHFTPVVSSTNLSHSYPTSSAKKRDWDKIVVDLQKDEESENVEGEGAVNNLFQKIYSEGSDEVKKAMNKSFTESGGTVLSTNWTDIGTKKVDVKPPDGMEWKSWET